MRRFSRLPAASSMRKPCGSAASRLTVWRRAHRPSAIVTACASSVVSVAAGLFAPSTGPGERRVVVMTWESTATLMRCARRNQLVTGHLGAHGAPDAKMAATRIAYRRGQLRRQGDSLGACHRAACFSVRPLRRLPYSHKECGTLRDSRLMDGRGARRATRARIREPRQSLPRLLQSALLVRGGRVPLRRRRRGEGRRSVVPAEPGARDLVAASRARCRALEAGARGGRRSLANTGGATVTGARGTGLSAALRW